MPTRTSGIHGGTAAISERWCEKHGRGSKFHSTVVIRRGGWFQFVAQSSALGCFRVFAIACRPKIAVHFASTVEPRHVDVQTRSYMCRVVCYHDASATQSTLRAEAVPCVAAARSLQRTVPAELVRFTLTMGAQVAPACNTAEHMRTTAVGVSRPAPGPGFLPGALRSPSRRHRLPAPSTTGVWYSVYTQ